MKPWQMMQRFGQPPTGGGGGDPYWANVVSLLHFDGADGSTTFTDVKSRSWTRTGDTKIVTAQSMFGGASAFFDGTGDSLRSANSEDFNLAAADFTVEFFARFASLANAPHLLQIGTSLYNRAGLYCRDGQLRWYTEVGGPYTGADRITSAALSINTWYHIAVSKQGATTRLFIDGVLIGSTTASVYNGNSDICLGFMQYASAAGDYLNGWIDEFRHTKGVARYTANFTPPSAPFPNG